MLFGPKVRYFNELEINGEHVDDSDNEDFTNEQPDPDEDETEDTDTEAVDDTDDELDDFTEDEFDAGDEETEEDTEEEPAEENEEVEELDDFTEDEFDSGDEDPETNPDVDETPTEEDDAGGEDDLTDFTEDEFDADGGDADVEAENPEDETAEENSAETSDESEEVTEDNNQGDGNTLADMEKNLFADLSPQQLAIKNNELLHNYIELYETINTVFDSINKIPKTFDNTRPLTFIADQLVELKDMVNYVITTTYVTRTYVENMTYYKQALVVLEQINAMLKALIQKPAK